MASVKVESQCPSDTLVKYFRHNVLSSDGGQATVYLCTKQPHCGRLFVMKIYNERNQAYVGNPSHRDLIRQIQSNSKSTVGQHIVTILESPTPKDPIMIMEYCNGGDLAYLIDSHYYFDEQIRESFIWHIYLALSKAVDFLHTGYERSSSLGGKPWRPIIHRDIKPENVVLLQNVDDPDGYPIAKLTDFDSSDFHDYGIQNTYFGTPRHWPPEAIQLGHQTMAGDIWAVGGVIHELALGYNPSHCWSCDVDDPVDPKHCGEGHRGLVMARRKRFVTPISPLYSLELAECMYHALTHDPVARIDATALRIAVAHGAISHGAPQVSEDIPLRLTYNSLYLETWEAPTNNPDSLDGGFAR